MDAVICLLHRLAVLALIVASQQALAETDQPSSADTEAEMDASGTADWDANERVLDDMEAWKTTNPMARGLLKRDDVLVVEGTAFVALSADDKRWPKARSLAYQQAFMNAMGEYVSLIRTRVTTRLIQEQFEQDLDESELTFDPEDTVSSQARTGFGKTRHTRGTQIGSGACRLRNERRGNRPPYPGPKKDHVLGPYHETVRRERLSGRLPDSFRSRRSKRLTVKATRPSAWWRLPQGGCADLRRRSRGENP